jgi:C-terminal domain of alpha-glycerophosphate oxidase
MFANGLKSGRLGDEMKNIHAKSDIISGYPYLLAEIIYAVRYEWAMHVNDIIARRTRLAFLDKTAAQLAIPVVTNVMSSELKWNDKKKRQEAQHCLEYLRHFGGPVPAATPRKLINETDIAALFDRLDAGGLGKIDAVQVMVLAEMLDRPLEAREVDNCMWGKSHIDLLSLSRWLLRNKANDSK